MAAPNQIEKTERTKAANGAGSLEGSSFLRLGLLRKEGKTTAEAGKVPAVAAEMDRSSRMDRSVELET